MKAAGGYDLEGEVIQALGFWARLQPIEGAIEGVRQLMAAGHQVRFCSSPWIPHATCEAEKRQWLERYFGPEIAADAFIGPDKTICPGDILIDDKPDITGSQQPEWRQVVFDQPWNQDVPGLRMKGWSDLQMIDRIDL